MSNLAASNADEPPRKTNHPPSSSLSSPSLFSVSLPPENVLKILACVPKRCYPILCCVSKKMRSLVRSHDLYKTRSLLGKDSLYVCFTDETKHPWTCHWFILRRIENNVTENVFVSIHFPLLPYPLRYSSSVVTFGQEIIFLPGSNVPSSSFEIFDTQSGTVRQGPRMLLNRMHNSVGLVGGKIYVIGGDRDDELPAESFDLKTQTWEAAPIPENRGSHRWISATNLSVDRKVYDLSYFEGMTCYDTRDGSCERSELPNDKWWRTGVCVIDNVLYVYFSRFGLMWYDSVLMLWRVVYGLDLGQARSIGMAEYYGKLAFLWEEPSPFRSDSKTIWCRMIVLDKSEAGIHGTPEPSQLVGFVPRCYHLYHCLSLG